MSFLKEINKRMIQLRGKKERNEAGVSEVTMRKGRCAPHSPRVETMLVHVWSLAA